MSSKRSHASANQMSLVAPSSGSLRNTGPPPRSNIDFCLSRKLHAMQSIERLRLKDINLLQRFISKLPQALGYPVAICHKDSRPVHSSPWNKDFSKTMSKSVNRSLTAILRKKISNPDYFAAIMPDSDWCVIPRDSPSKSLSHPSIVRQFEQRNSKSQSTLICKLKNLQQAVISAKSSGNLNKLSTVCKSVPVRSHKNVETVTVTRDEKPISGTVQTTRPAQLNYDPQFDATLECVSVSGFSRNSDDEEYY